MSLKQSLVLAFSVLLTLVGLLAGAYSYWTARQEAWTLLDLQQQQIARFVGDGQALFQGTTGLPPHDSDEDYVIRIDYVDGRPAVQSSARLVFPKGLADGFADVADQSGLWRVFTLRATSQIVQVAQRTNERDELAADSAFHSALPFFLALPIVWALVYAIVGSIMAQVSTITRMVQTRAMDDTTPLPVDRAPVELRPLVSATNDALLRTNHALTQQRLFLANAAHELRTPLAALLVQAGNLRSAQNPADWRGRAGDVEAGITRLSALVNQLLLLARQEAGYPAFDSQTTDLGDAILATVAALHPLAHDKGMDIGVDLPDAASVIGTKRDIEVMLEAVIHNAIHYAPPGSQIDIAMIGDKDAVAITVTDNGPGIRQDQLNTVFDRFVRAADPAKSGSGLGLSIAKAVVERLGGSIDLSNRTDLGDSKDRPGLIVTMTLPIAPNARA